MKSRSMPRGARVALALGLVLGLLALAPLGVAQSGAAADAEVVPAVNLSPQQAATAQQIKSEVMAPCCWNGTVDTHISPIAMKISDQINYWVAEGMPKEEMLNRLAKQYTERVLARPRSEGLGLVFWLGPVVAGAAGFFFVRRWIRKHSAGSLGDVSVAPASSVASSTDRDDAWNSRFEQQLKSLD